MHDSCCAGIIDQLTKLKVITGLHPSAPLPLHHCHTLINKYLRIELCLPQIARRSREQVQAVSSQPAITAGCQWTRSPTHVSSWQTTAGGRVPEGAWALCCPSFCIACCQRMRTSGAATRYM